MQIALVLSDRMKSLTVIRMLSEHSFEVSNFILKFLPMVGSAPSWSSSRPLVSLTSLSFFIIKFLVWVSLTPLPGQNYLSTSPSLVQGSNYPVVSPVADQWLSNRTTCSLISHVSSQIRRLVGYFVFPTRPLQGCESTPGSSGLCFPFFQFRFVPGPILFLAWRDLLARSAHCRL